MNTTEHYVLEVIGSPVHHKFEDGLDCYTVKVKCNCYGRESIDEVFCNTKEEAESIKKGSMYLA